MHLREEFLVSAENPDAWKEAISRLLSEPRDVSELMIKDAQRYSDDYFFVSNFLRLGSNYLRIKSDNRKVLDRWRNA